MSNRRHNSRQKVRNQKDRFSKSDYSKRGMYSKKHIKDKEGLKKEIYIF